MLSAYSDFGQEQGATGVCSVQPPVDGVSHYLSFSWTLQFTIVVVETNIQMVRKYPRWKYPNERKIFIGSNCKAGEYLMCAEIMH